MSSQPISKHPAFRGLSTSERLVAALEYKKILERLRVQVEKTTGGHPEHTKTIMEKLEDFLLRGGYKLALKELESNTSRIIESVLSPPCAGAGGGAAPAGLSAVFQTVGGWFEEYSPDRADALMKTFKEVIEEGGYEHRVPDLCSRLGIPLPAAAGGAAVPVLGPVHNPTPRQPSSRAERRAAARLYPEVILEEAPVRIDPPVITEGHYIPNPGDPEGLSWL